MSSDSYKLYVYWGNRPATDRECAARCADMMVRLAGIDPVFGQWCETAMSREAASRPFCGMPPTIDELTRLFDNGRHYRGHPDIKDQPYRLCPERGMSITAWNGLDEPYGLGFSVSAGNYDDNRPQPNYVHFNITKHRLMTDRPWWGGELRDVLLAVVEAWDAIYAVIGGSRLADRIPRKVRNHYLWPYAGWLTYLTPPVSDGFVPPNDVMTERFANGAVLVTLCDEPCDPDNPRHMELADAMHRAMRPIQE